MKKLLIMVLVTTILSAALGIVAMATHDPHAWSIKSGNIITSP